MNQLPKDVIVNVIIPKIVEDKNREIEEVKKQNMVFKKIMHDAVMQDFIADIPCKTCDKHFVIIGSDFESYDSPINILDETIERVFLDCDNCNNYYCMDCVFKIPIETRRTHLYCPVCKTSSNINAELSKYTY